MKQIIIFFLEGESPILKKVYEIVNISDLLSYYRGFDLSPTCIAIERVEFEIVNEFCYLDDVIGQTQDIRHPVHRGHVTN